MPCLREPDVDEDTNTDNDCSRALHVMSDVSLAHGANQGTIPVQDLPDSLRLPQPFYLSIILWSCSYEVLVGI